MMRRFAYILCLILIMGCDSEKALDCFQASGDIVTEEFYGLEVFNKIIVWNRVQLFFSQGDIASVRVETGENLLNEIRVRVEDSILKVSDRNSCNFVRDYGITKVYVTAPNLKEIKNSSGLPVQNIGPIRFPALTLVSEDPIRDGSFHIDGDFIIDDLQVGSLFIRANGLSNFFLSGSSYQASFSAIDGDVRIDAGDLIVQNLSLYHRSTNEMIVNPQNYIIGRIVSIGNVIAKNRPSFVDVEELYQGRLIFE